MHAALLVATLVALMSGPMLYAVAQRRPALLGFLDGFVLVSIAGLVLIEVLPDAFGSGGLVSLLFLLVGLLGPTALEHGLTRARREAHLLALALAICGLVLHSIGDGTALSGEGGRHGDDALALAIAIHSVPVGLVVWWLLFPVFGAWLPGLALLAMCVATVAGYLFGIELGGLLGERGWAWFQALMSGSILHVIFGRPHLDETSAHHRTPPPYEGLGNLFALATLAWLALAHAPAQPLPGFVERLLQLGYESAPALLLAYVVGGLIGSEVPESWLRWMGRGGSAMQALRGMAIGLPLPICSCGVLPLYRSLIQRGVPVAAAVAFLIATPEVGLTALFVSVPLLGWEMTLLRVGAAALLAFAVAWLLTRAVPVPTPTTAAKSDCCKHCHAAGAPPPPSNRLGRALRSGLVDLVDDTVAWIIAGLVLAAAAMPYVDQVFWADLPDVLEIALFALIGMPIYVCAAGATPLVAVLIAGGVSPGAAIAFLLTGPATNISTFGVLRSLHGRRPALVFAALTGAGAILIGLGVNALAPSGLQSSIPAGHIHAPAWYESLSLLLLGLVYAASLLRKGGRALFADLFDLRDPAVG